MPISLIRFAFLLLLPAITSLGSSVEAQAPDPSKRVVDWPHLVGVVPGEKPILGSAKPPAYLAWQPVANSPGSENGRAATEVTRVTDAATFGVKANLMTHQYAKVSPWSADNRYALVYCDGSGPTRTVLIDGKTFEFLHVVPDTYTGGRWSMTDPNIYYQIALGFGPKLDATDVRDGKSTLKKDFTSLGYVQQARTSMFGGEGNQSIDDRFWVLQLKHRDRGWELVIWDAKDDVIPGSIKTDRLSGPGKDIDYWSVSPLGNFVITASTKTWQCQGTQIPKGVNLWSLDGSYLRTLPVSASGHIDYGLDVDGNEVAVFIGSKYGDNDKTCQSWRLDGSQGNNTTDQFRDGTVGWNFHISCACTSRPGYAVVSTFPSERPEWYDTFPMWNHAFAVRLDGSQTVAPIGRVHHDAGRSKNDLYLRSSFAVPNRDLSAVWFTAAWDRDERPVHSYVMRAKQDE